jgi:hypothetical protein
MWKIFNPNYDFLAPLYLYLVQKYEKNAVANDKCVFATCTEFIICFKIKNPPTLHSTSKIQPTTSPTFVFSVSASVRKNGVMKENC